MGCCGKDTYTIEEYKEKIGRELSFISYAPQIYISAKTGQRVHKLFELIDMCLENTTRRISTGLLNDCIRDAVISVETPTRMGRKLKIYYSTQVAVKPPTFVLFVNDVEILNDSFSRYIKNYIRRTFDFTGTPINVYFRNRNESKENK